MSQFWRASSITGVVLFLEGCAFYLLIAAVTAVLHYPAVGLPFWLVMLTLVWAFLLSYYVQTLRFSLNLRGITGLLISAVSLLLLAHLNTGLGLFPVGKLREGNLDTVATFALTAASLLLLWWRGSTIAHDEITLERVHGAFRWGLITLVAGVMVDALTLFKIVNGFLILAFFGVGLAGLSLARFSAETGAAQRLSSHWFIAIVVSVGAVLLLGLLVSGVGLGGLDDVTRALLELVGAVGLFVLKPLSLAVGYLAELLVQLVNWLSRVFGGGDLSRLLEAQAQVQQFQEDVRREATHVGTPAVLVLLAKWSAFLVVTFLVGWLIFRIFRFRTLWGRPSEVEVEETRESLLTWTKANQDLASLVRGWWHNLATVGGRQRRRQPEPRNPRELYHSLLLLAEELGQPRLDWQTPREHQRVLVGLLPIEPVGRIVEDFQLVHYGGCEVDRSEMERLLADWATLRQHAAEERPAS